MAFVHPIAKLEMGGAGEPPMGSDSAAPPSEIGSGGGGGVGKIDRVFSCGFEKGGAVKRAKKEFVLPSNFLSPLPRPIVFAPAPLSIRPGPGFSMKSPVAPISNVRPVTPLSTFPPVLPFPMVPPVATPSSIIKPIRPPSKPEKTVAKAEANGCKQFWKAGDYDGPAESSTSFSAEIDRVRVHPKFLHSNATSHKWALGALAELLDNSIDEVCNGATFVNINVLENPRDKTKMLLVEDNGGGMNPDEMRQCMSLGFSAKSKSANTIGQYGNGFKTSTMRLGADVIVFSRCQGKDGMNPTQSIGILSYTFLRSTRKQDIIVPMVDYVKKGDDWLPIERSSSIAWKTNMDSILQWSPYGSEGDLLQQFNSMLDHGTRIFIYNLWEDDEGNLELDFVTDSQDIQISGAKRDEKKIEMSKKFQNSKHFLTYHHSLRSYASILYLRLPQGFKMILRGKEIVHHNIVNDMMMQEEKIYRPQPGYDGVPKDSSFFAVVTIGFVKDATNHIDVQGFNVYHKNRLIKPFWRVWNAAGSNGRGVIGVLEANFIEPAHDKQGFERTTVLNRLEARLLHIQKTYWSSNCHKIGYASTSRHHKEAISNPEDKGESSPNIVQSQDSTIHQNSRKHSLHHDARESGSSVKDEFKNFVSVKSSKKPRKNGDQELEERISFQQLRPEPFDTECGPTRKNLDGSDEAACSSLLPSSLLNYELRHAAGSETKNILISSSCSKKMGTDCYVNEHNPLNSSMHSKLLADENRALKERLKIMEGKLQDLQMEREKSEELTKKVEFLEKRLRDAYNERERRDKEEEALRNKLEVSNNTIKILENLGTGGLKPELQF